MSDHHDTQPSVVEYARFHGLAVGHLKQDIHRCFPWDVLTPVENEMLPELKLPHVATIPPEPKFKLDSKSASLLARSLTSPPAPQWSNMLSDHSQVKKLKLEQPVLRTDHQADMKKIRCRKPHKIGPLISLLPIELDEGLAWSLELRELSATWDRKLAEEKLQSTREVLKALQDTLRPVHTPQMHEAIITEELASTKRTRLQPISPPLLPFEDDQQPYIPSSPALHMPLLSDCSNPDNERMQQLNEDIAKQSCITTEDAAPATVGQIDRLLDFAEHGPTPDEMASLEVSEPTITNKKKQPHLLKLESPDVEPLTPPRSCTKSDAKRVTFALVLENLIPGQMRCEDTISEDTDQPFKDELFARMTREAAQALDKNLATEKLEQADIIMRVEVPKLRDVNFSMAEESTTSKEFLQTMTKHHLNRTRRRFDKAEERNMKWAPIPSTCLKPVVEEFVETSSQLDRWISQPRLNVTSKDLLWRPEMLRALTIGEESDEEELEEDSSLQDEPPQVSKMVVKRPVPHDPVPHDSEESVFQGQPRQLPLPEVCLDTFGFGSLAGFMDTRQAFKKPRLESKVERNEIVQAKTPPCIEVKSAEVDEIQIPGTPKASSVMDFATLQTPQLPKDTSQRTIIVNSKLLGSHRHLVHALETRQDPARNIIYRTLQNSEHSGTEPDIILAPTIAAIFTTLQATTQRSLPGQGPSYPPIFKRILNLTHVYDRLFILTTLPPATDTSPFLSSPSCSQISTLTSFCTSLSQPRSDCIVQAILVPSHPQPTNPKLPTTSNQPWKRDHLTQWTSALIQQHGLNPTSLSLPTYHSLNLTLIPEETLWELFLTHAGLNPYAAQVVLAVLKKPASHTPSTSVTVGHNRQEGRENKGGEPALWGLRSFIQMPRQDRLSLFEVILGSRAVERVSDVLDSHLGWGGIEDGWERRFEGEGMLVD